MDDTFRKRIKEIDQLIKKLEEERADIEQYLSTVERPSAQEEPAPKTVQQPQVSQPAKVSKSGLPHLDLSLQRRNPISVQPKQKAAASEDPNITEFEKYMLEKKKVSEVSFYKNTPSPQTVEQLPTRQNLEQTPPPRVEYPPQEQEMPPLMDNDYVPESLPPLQMYPQEQKPNKILQIIIIVLVIIIVILAAAYFKPFGLFK